MVVQKNTAKVVLILKTTLEHGDGTFIDIFRFLPKAGKQMMLGFISQHREMNDAKKTK
jgi:hypothetical protein